MKFINITLFVVFLIILSSCQARSETILTGTAGDIIMAIRGNADLPAMTVYNKGNPNGASILKNYYGIRNASLIDDFCVLLSKENNYTEIALFIVSDTQNLDMVIQAIQERYNKLYQSCKNLSPDKINKVKNKLLTKYKNAVVFAVYDENNNNDINEILDKYVKQA